MKKLIFCCRMLAKIRSLNVIYINMKIFIYVFLTNIYSETV